MPAVRFTAAGTFIICATRFLPMATSRGMTPTTSPSCERRMRKLIFSRENPTGSASPRAAMRP